jgi:hypothetical protein
MSDIEVLDENYCLSCYSEGYYSKKTMFCLIIRFLVIAKYHQNADIQLECV